MAAPQSARQLPMELLNTGAPLCEGEATTSEGEKIRVQSYISQAWRYLFGTFVLSTTAIDPAWTQEVSNPPTQAEVQAIVAQVSLLSQQVGRIE